MSNMFKMEPYLPAEWEDDERMRVLMKDMPDVKEKAAYNARITFWTANLHNWVRRKEGVCFTLHDAQMAFRKGTQVPQCFTHVLQHMMKHGEIISFEELGLKKSENQSESWVSWSKRVFVATPSRWAWKTVQDTIGNKSIENIVFIDWVVLQELSDSVLSQYFLSNKFIDSHDKILTVEDLFKLSKSMVKRLTIEDMDLIVNILVYRGKATVSMHDGMTFVKLAKPGQTKVPNITLSDIAEHKMLITEIKLHQRSMEMKLEISALRLQAKEEVLSGSKIQALSLMRRKKRLEKSLETTLSAHENILSCLQQIQESKLNIEVLQAFQMGVTTLKQNIAATGPAEDIAEKMDSLQEVLDECNDITQSLSAGLKISGVNDDDDDDDLEKELNDLLQCNSLTDSLKEDDPNFPPVPTYDPLDLVSTSPKRSETKKEIAFS